MMIQIPSFDVQHAILFDAPDPTPFIINQHESLADVITSGFISEDTHVLLSLVDGQAIVIPTLSLIFHKVAQGVFNQRHIFLSFCVLCNSGSVFSPQVQGQTLTFGCCGYYQGMTLLGDLETLSRWSHITGDCLYGDYQGTQLERLDDLVHMTAQQALTQHPEARIVTPAFSTEQSEMAHQWNETYRQAKQPNWSDGLVSTLAYQDNRLPRFDMGVGIWTPTTARYYRVLDLNNEDNVITDTIDGQQVLIYMDSASGLPGAFYYPSQHVSRPSEDEIRLDDGAIFKNNVIHQHGQLITPERPYYQVMRWYGFAYLFPDCEIYSI